MVAGGRSERGQQAEWTYKVLTVRRFKVPTLSDNCTVGRECDSDSGRDSLTVSDRQLQSWVDGCVRVPDARLPDWLAPAVLTGHLPRP
jgi:hypothetical protein